MTITLRHVSALFVAAAVTMATSAFAQGPSEAQRAAVKAQCRSDYMANCSSVTPGGKEALQCLAQHMSSLSSGCQEAVKAVEASVAAPKEEPKQETKEEGKPEAKPEAPAPATEAAKPAAEAPPKAAAAAPAKKPSSAQIAAVKSNCRSDYMKVCSSVTPGGPAALQCLEKNEPRLSASCKKAVAAAGGGGAAPAAAGGAPATANAAPDAAPPAGGAATAPAAAPLVLRPMRPIEVLGVMRSACGVDVRTLCPGVPPGGGRIISCLVEQSASLSPACREVLGQFAAQ